MVYGNSLYHTSTNDNKFKDAIQGEANAIQANAIQTNAIQDNANAIQDNAIHKGEH